MFITPLSLLHLHSSTVTNFRAIIFTSFEFIFPFPSPSVILPLSVLLYPLLNPGSHLNYFYPCSVHTSSFAKSTVLHSLSLLLIRSYPVPVYLHFYFLPLTVFAALHCSCTISMLASLSPSFPVACIALLSRPSQPSPISFQPFF